MAVGALLYASPLLLMLSNAFKSQSEIVSTRQTLLPLHPSLDAFLTVFNETPYLTWFRNSIVIAVLGTALTVCTSLIGGYVYGKFDFPGRRLSFGLILMSLMVPFPVLLVPVYIVATKLHLINTFPALLLPYIVSPFGVFLMRQFAAQLPSDLLDAARMDGASEGRILWTIAAPLLRAPAAALAVFTFLASWNDYLWPLIAVSEPAQSTLPLALSFFNTQNTSRYDLLMAATTMSVIPVFVVFAVLQRHIVRSLMLTGFK
jgi:multiple sugar transport system permease protein